MGGKFVKKDKNVPHNYNLGPKRHITMVQMAKAAQVKPCTIQQNVNILMKMLADERK